MLFKTRNYKKDYFRNIDDKKTFLRIFYATALWFDDKLDRLYYKYTRKSRYSSTELEKVRSIYIFEEPIRQAKFIKVKKWSYIMCCFLIGFSLTTILFYTKKNYSSLSGDKLKRPNFGEGDTTYELTVKGIDNSDISLDINVSQQVPDEEILMQVFDEKIEEIKEKILGSNKSLNEVRTNLNLLTVTKEGIRISWESQDSDWINEWGEIVAEQIPKEGYLAILVARLSYAGYEVMYQIPVKLLPPLETRSHIIAQFKAMLDQKDKSEVNSKYLSLPSKWEDKTITYQLTSDNQSMQICGLSLLSAFCIAILYEKSINTKKKKRDKELLLDYSTVISQIALLIHAGLTVRLAWERIVIDYQMEREKGNKEKRYVYEEMSQVYYKLKGGSSEILELREFGKKCGLYQYQKFVNILEQYITQGSANTEKLLSDEMFTALSNKKNEAIKVGEEINIKLLVPMLMMLGIVLIVIIVPAFMSLQF